ncbi:hypothetical protein [Deinococcus aquatilis]|uniref:hypothetical protein n=1 Tax=Deinococcus aquatilis TaxID=519440 RepID=UPI000369E820|nr:hypothetical protein [Deinococcus aquatilis]
MTDAPKKRSPPTRRAKAPPTDPASLPLSRVQTVVAHRPLSVLEVQDSADLDALLLDTRLAGQIVSRLGPTFALLTPGSEKAVLEALRKAGHLPRVVGG